MNIFAVVTLTLAITLTLVAVSYFLICLGEKLEAEGELFKAQAIKFKRENCIRD